VLHVCVMEVFYYLLLVWLLIFCDLKRWGKREELSTIHYCDGGRCSIPCCFLYIHTHTHTTERERERERERENEGNRPITVSKETYYSIKRDPCRSIAHNKLSRFISLALSHTLSHSLSRKRDVL